MTLDVARHAFSKAELEQLRGWVGRRFDRIYSDEVCIFMFVAGEEAWRAMPQDFVALSQNPRGDEVLAVRLEPLSQLSEKDLSGLQLIAENVVVEELQIVRALIWFTDHETFASAAEAEAHADEEADPKVRALKAGCVGRHEEVTTHPSDLDTVDAPVANLVDAGFIVRIDEVQLACFSWWNCFIRESDYLTDEAREDVLTHYELIPIGVAQGE